MRINSNYYIVIFASIMTIVLGGLLSLASEGLKPLQKEQIALYTKKQILSAVISIEDINTDQIVQIYSDRVKSIIVNYNGEKLDSLQDKNGKLITPENVDIAKEFKKKKEERYYPIFEYVSQGDKEEIEAYILPMYGNGLWDSIWGYIAIGPDLNTLKGVAFDHKKETPGLGARITSLEVQNRFKGKTIYDENKEFISVSMLKREGNPNLTSHQVDGMSGATITGRGINAMLKSYFQIYENFFKQIEIKK